MRSSSAKLLSLLSRHAVEQQLASTEAGATLHSLLRRGSGQLWQQARNSSTAKPGAPLPSPGQAPPLEPPVQRRSYSAKPQLQKVDRPWHRHERDVGGPQKQQAQRTGPKQAANGELTAAQGQDPPARGVVLSPCCAKRNTPRCHHLACPHMPALLLRCWS